MTAILNKIRMLEASRDSGALTEEDFARAKARLLDEIEDAVETDESAAAEDAAPKPSKAAKRPTPKSSPRRKPAKAPRPEAVYETKATEPAPEAEDITFFAPPDDPPEVDPVEVAELEPIEEPDESEDRPVFTEPPAQSVWHVVMLCVAALLLIGLTVFFVVGDAMLAITVVLTLVAAISVRVVQIMDD